MMSELTLETAFMQNKLSRLYKSIMSKYESIISNVYYDGKSDLILELNGTTKTSINIILKSSEQVKHNVDTLMKHYMKNT